MTDNVNHPAHYTQGGVECIDALAAAVINLQGLEAVCTANAIKYLWRWKEKNGVEDLRKAKWYIDKLIDKMGGKVEATVDAYVSKWHNGNEAPPNDCRILVRLENKTDITMCYVDRNGNIFVTHNSHLIATQKIKYWCSIDLNLEGAQNGR